MVFKLVRIDTQEPSKIQLSIGTHVIGRGKFLHNDDTDKRVSRSHAEMEVTADTVKLKSLHQNPCFYIKKSTDETQLLQQDKTTCLCHGDKFGLLPEHFWYEVIHCPNQDTTEETTIVPKPTDNELHNGEEQKMDQTEGVQNNVTSESNADKANGEAMHFEDNEVVADLNRSASPSLLTAGQESTGDDDEVKPPLVDETSSPVKRSHSSGETSPVDAKRVKTEPVDIKTEPGDAVDSTAGPSNGQLASGDTDGKDKATAPASPTKPLPARERCIYGANCYRRNPAHKAAFSHPADADWGGGARGVCPYGHACRKPDPRHWAAHDHPPGVQPPRPGAPTPGMQVVQRHGNIFYINAHSVNFYDDHFQVEDSDGESVDYDYEF